MRILFSLLIFFFSWPAFADNPCGGATGGIQKDISDALDTAQDADICPPSAPPSAGITLSPDAFVKKGLREDVLSLALTAFENAWQKGQADRKILMVVDFSRLSSKKRLWVIDLNTNELLFHEWVGHGKKSGAGDASTRFSNTPKSKQSSIGVYTTGKYHPTSAGQRNHKGTKPSLTVHGLEEGWNDKANSRSILIHEAWYTYPGHGGHSEGCFTVRPKIRESFLTTLYGASNADDKSNHQSESHDTNHEGEGHHSLIFAYYPDKNWLDSSSYLKSTP